MLEQNNECKECEYTDKCSDCRFVEDTYYYDGKHKIKVYAVNRNPVFNEMCAYIKLPYDYVQVLVDFLDKTKIWINVCENELIQVKGK